jgi:CTP synthase (UTP-ammonia lyase)
MLFSKYPYLYKMYYIFNQPQIIIFLQNFSHKVKSLYFQEVRIALVGKYTKLEDAYASVIKAMNHAR